MPNDVEAPARARARAWFGDTKNRYVCPSCNITVTDVARRAFDLGFGAGMRFAIRRTSQVTPYVQQFVELLTFVFGRDDYYTELYLSARDVYSTHGRDTSKLERMGRALASISNGEISDQTTDIQHPSQMWEG